MSRTALLNQGAGDSASLIRTNEAAPPVQIPHGHVGPVVLPGTGRMVWWTGRVAIGLRHQPTRNFGPITQSAMWIQSVLLRERSGELATA
ncbi:MAG: hypothetical protein V4792_19400 [Pseudomonadota bacterium]